MNYAIYLKHLRLYLRQAIEQSDGSNRGIAEALEEIRLGRWDLFHRQEKQRALHDARRAFEEHRHWPREIILSHLGVSLDDEQFPD